MHEVVSDRGGEGLHSSADCVVCCIPESKMKYYIAMLMACPIHTRVGMLQEERKCKYCNGIDFIILLTVLCLYFRSGEKIVYYE